VASSQNVASHNTNGSAFSADNGNTVGLSSGVKLECLDTGAKLEGWARISIILVCTKELDILEVVGPDGKRALSDTFGRRCISICTDWLNVERVVILPLGVEIVSGVLDNQSEVQATGQVDGKLDLGDILD